MSGARAKTRSAALGSVKSMELHLSFDPWLIEMPLYIDGWRGKPESSGPEERSGDETKTRLHAQNRDSA
jgi:hypothetical protein